MVAESGNTLIISDVDSSVGRLSAGVVGLVSADESTIPDGQSGGLAASAGLAWFRAIGSQKGRLVWPATPQ
jgi:hypothetical protein